jgi:Xaa-Pro dipeptidase
VPLQLIPKSEIESRIQRTQTRLRGADVEAALVIQRADLFYLTGTAQNGYLSLPTEGEPLFLTLRSRNRAREESPLPNVVPLDSSRRLAEALRENGHGGWRRIGIELDVLPARDYLRIKAQFPGVDFVDISNEIREIRSIKSEYEIRQLEGAAEILRNVFEKVPAILSEAEREIDAAAAIEGELRRNRHQGLIRVRRWNMEMMGATVVAGPSASYPTAFDGADGVEGLYVAVPQSGGERLLRSGEPIMVDIVAGFGGYLVDKTRIYVIGRLRDQEMMDAHRFALKLQSEIAQRLRPGSVCGQIWSQVVEMVSSTPFKTGFMGWGENQVSFVGHGVGLELDELPVISPRSDTTIREGMAIAVEPKFFFGDRGGVGVENTWVVTPEGCRNLTADSSDEIIPV